MTNSEIPLDPTPLTVEWAEDKIKLLEESALLYTVSERIILVVSLTEAFFEKFGFHMSGSMLYRLSNVLLADSLRNPAKSKEDHPVVLSDKQLRRRKFGIHDKGSGREVSFNAALTVATDGRVYALPKRKFKNMYE